jgi:hypothetical protein
MLLAVDNILGQPKIEIRTINMGPRECDFSGYVQWRHMLLARKKKDTCNLHVSHIQEGYLKLLIKKKKAT